MVVEKIGVNSVNRQSFGALPAVQNPQATAQVPAKKRDTSKVIAWSLAGLATAGLAGVLIYNAVKGRGGASSTPDPFASLGTYLKKYLNEAHFAKSMQECREGSQDVVMRVSPDKNDIQMFNLAEGFRCHLVKQTPPNRTDVPNFEFNSEAMDIRIFNKDKDTARFEFGFKAPDRTMDLSIEAEPWRGQIKSHSLTDGTETYTYSEEQCKVLLDDLDIQKLIDDKTYRVNYLLSHLCLMNDIVKNSKLQKIANKFGKSLKEVEDIYKSPEFNQAGDFAVAFVRYNQSYNLIGSAYESSLLKGLRGKDSYGLLEDFMSGSIKVNKTNAQAQGIIHLPEDKVLYEYSVRSEDGSQVLERICYSPENDYTLYERVNPEDLTKKLRIESLEPTGEEGTSSRMVIDVEDISFSRISSGEHNRIEISHPDRPETIKFSFSSADGQPKEYDDALEPYKSYMEKLIQRILKDEDYDQFISDFPTRGKEIMAELAKVEEASA